MYAGDGAEPRAHRAADQLADLRRSVEHLARDDPRAIGVGREEAVKLAEHGVEPIVARGRGEEQARQRLLPVREDGVEHRLADVLLRREVVQDGGLAHADGVRDVLQRGAVEPVRREEARRRGHGRPADVVLCSSRRYHLGRRCLPYGRHVRKGRRRPDRASSRPLGSPAVGARENAPPLGSGRPCGIFGGSR